MVSLVPPTMYGGARARRAHKSHPGADLSRCIEGGEVSSALRECWIRLLPRLARQRRDPARQRLAVRLRPGDECLVLLVVKREGLAAAAAIHHDHAIAATLAEFDCLSDSVARIAAEV